MAALVRTWQLMSWCQGRRGCLRHEDLSRNRSLPPPACT